MMQKQKWKSKKFSGSRILLQTPIQSQIQFDLGLGFYVWVAPTSFRVSRALTADKYPFIRRWFGTLLSIVPNIIHH